MIDGYYHNISLLKDELRQFSKTQQLKVDQTVQPDAQLSLYKSPFWTVTKKYSCIVKTSGGENGTQPDLN